MTCRRYIVIASAALLVVGALAVSGVSNASGGKGSCSASCRASYGNCYKKTQDRAKCQAQLQRCLESCIHKNKK